MCLHLGDIYIYVHFNMWAIMQGVRGVRWWSLPDQVYAVVVA